MRILFVISFFLNLLFKMLNFIIKMCNFNKSRQIPPTNDDLFDLSASVLAKKIRFGEITSQEVVKAYIQRIKLVNPIINAVIEDRFEKALEEAMMCDRKIKNGELTIFEMEKQKPLYGVPFTVKESCMLKGLSYTGGSYAQKGRKALDNGEAIELMINAGGIPLCVTNIPELCTGFDSYNFLYGKTYNPYNTKCGAGGSSGGEGALIGSGSSLIGIGSDLAGSIRIPALFNGIFGHKPSRGIVSVKGHLPLPDDEVFIRCGTVGPLARYVEDLYLTMKVLTVKHNQDLHLDDPVNLKKLNVYYLENIEDKFGIIQTQQEIRTCIREAVRHLQDCGSNVEKYPGSFSNLCDAILNRILSMKFPILLDPNNSKNERSLICELPKSILGCSKYTFGAIFIKFLSIIVKRNESMDEGLKIQCQYLTNLLNDNGVIILPTFALTAPVGRLIQLIMINGLYCPIWNYFGFPATNVPMGFDKNGLPIGFQVIAAPYQDRLCLAVAKELEKSFGGWIPPYRS
ncbi:PREDICTED: fatty-acid amide hydrolase 2-B-like [Polistes dominula]|uniref:Fatty-acid amide hydrolase 2-B-like n=1 Tax=Polistes dominula TaxID=743375 RepID=A0ABM1J1F4_POLDO|nr:PREDICTED: fatty-acid amide hydrolase 2-B-like [Polistes dominula]XP_015186291.1 PREDICTED: fatty-acid amide hydrolase 2-B-like [Polistes dominula]